MNVLVVDDSQLNLAIAKKYLETIPDITQILLCSAPSEAKSLLNDNIIDILILDIIMPEISGLDLLSQIRSNPDYDDMPIIMLTSLDDLESYKKCFELGAFDYIYKPINALEFNARVKVAVEAKNNSNNLKSLIEVTKKQYDELKMINSQLNETKFTLVQSEKMAAIGQLAAGIAHEINNPMGFVSSNFESLHKYFNRIVEFLEFVQGRINGSEFTGHPELEGVAQEIRNKYKSLKLDPILAEMKDIFTESQDGINRVTEIVKSLRLFSRTPKNDEKDTYILLEILHQVLLITQNEVKYVADINLDVPDDILLFCNRVLLGRVFVNIILNAAQAIQAQERDEFGHIRIIARKEEQSVRLWFSDDGPGIPEEHLHKIFEPFFTTKDIGQGTGLGLSISYDIIVNKHNGTMEVQSEPGKGATFIITLPIVTNE